jgi:hypothetical protein
MMFWIGLLIGAAILAIVYWIRNRNLSLKWYEWLMGAIAVLLIFVAVQHYFGALEEYVSKSAWMGILIFGLPALILLSLTWQLIARRNKAV